MRVGKAPLATYVHITVRVDLMNGRTEVYIWDTPMALSSAYHKGPRWAADVMKKEKIRGRSQVRGLYVKAEIRQGSWKRND